MARTSVLVRLDASLLARIDAAVAETGRSRNAVLVEALASAFPAVRDRPRPPSSGLLPVRAPRSLTGR